MYNILIAILVAAAYIPTAFSDTPANCSYGDISGTWSFHIGPTGFDINSIDCTDDFEIKKNISVQLNFPDVAIDEFGNQGFWTMIYNQGFEVVVGNHKYFAFSNFTVVNKNTTYSYCDSTFNGWSHDVLGNNWACYFGRKVADTHRTLKIASRLPVLDLYRKYVKNEHFINEINAKTNLWTAVHYPELEDMTLRDRLLRAGGLPNHNRIPFPRTVTVELRTLASKLPASFDWRDYNYVSPIRNQGKCGSCYAFGSMAMLEARIRLITNNSLTPVFSTQEIVSCSKYAQGCEGGFPYLIAGKYGEDFGVVEESCFPYLGKDSKCTMKPGCLRYRTIDYYYVGGFYGGCSEEAMRVELVRNGPVAVSFEVLPDFQAYKSGIYHHTDLEDGYNPWEITNHVVLVVGYGEEDGTKFWIVKNSWGEKWGEEGFFRIMRGNDEMSIESMAVAVTPIIP